MELLVCIKQVPDTSEIKLDPETNNLIRTGLPSIVNPDDMHALEAALTVPMMQYSLQTARSVVPIHWLLAIPLRLPSVIFNGL